MEFKCKGSFTKSGVHFLSRTHLAHTKHTLDAVVGCSLKAHGLSLPVLRSVVSFL